MEQPQYNMFYREKVETEYAPLYGGIGLGTTIWSPLAGGLLTGKYNAGNPGGTRISVKGYEWLQDRYEGEKATEKLAAVRALTPLAAELGADLPCLALAWCLKNPRVSTVIMGASRVEQLTNNLRALETLPKLTDDVMERIEGILGGKPV